MVCSPAVARVSIVRGGEIVSRPVGPSEFVVSPPSGVPERAVGRRDMGVSCCYVLPAEPGRVPLLSGVVLVGRTRNFTFREESHTPAIKAFHLLTKKKIDFFTERPQCKLLI